MTKQAQTAIYYKEQHLPVSILPLCTFVMTKSKKQETSLPLIISHSNKCRRLCLLALLRKQYHTKLKSKGKNTGGKGLRFCPYLHFLLPSWKQTLSPPFL